MAHKWTRCGADGDGDDSVTALAELLLLYSGLLGDSVSGAARALTQATQAAAGVRLMCGGALAEHPLQRVRLSRSLALTAAEAAAREQQQSLEESEQSPSGVDRQQRRQRIRRRGAGRRWFTQEHVQELQREGVVFARGKFTAEENAAVEETIARFVGAQRLTAQQVYEKLFHDKTRDSMGRQVRKAFWPALAEALPARQMQALYHHVRRRCHPLNNLGSWTAREDDALRRLVAARGPAWEAISGEMGRMGTNCRDRWRYLQASGRGGDGLPGGD